MYRRSHLPLQRHGGCDMIEATRKILEQLASGRVPEYIPDDAVCAQELKRLAEYFSAVQHFTIALGNGDLTASLKGFGGPVAGGLKSIQASLRHLSWQTRQVAAGDFSQKVDFMGEFAASFNAMVAGLAAAREEMECMNVRLQDDLVRQKEMAETLRNKEERFRLITEKVNAVIWTMDASTLRFTYVGPYISKLRGLTVEEALAESFEESLTPDSRLRVMDKMAQKKARYMETGDISVFFDCIEVEQICRNGQVIPIEMVISAITDNSGNLKEYLGISRDISARKAVESQLTYLSHHDSLTGLFNRAFLDIALERAVEGERFPLSIIVADLDGLKLVNDTLGHAAGDRLLKGAATVLHMAFRSDDVIARTGGDEFVVLLHGMAEDEAIKKLGRVRGCEGNFNRTQAGPPLSISLGVATALRGEDVPRMLGEADARMYAEKALRKQQKGL
ncbi:MAG: diguanylate cyclase [Desulfuromonadales bacterium]|nr:diguanylate cyclase [Desulfuromonadales bacterium]